MSSYAIKILDKAEALARYTHVWATARKILPKLGDKEMSLVVSLVVDTCALCHSGPASCACWRRPGEKAD